MRRLFMILAVLALTFSLAIGVSAATEASSVSCHATVSSDESCDVTMTAIFRLEEAVSELSFPVPAKASGVTLNGSRVGSSVSGKVRLIDLTQITGGMAGEFSAVITYRLSDVVAFNDEGLLVLEVPLLSGFDYPVKKIECSVMLPGEVVSKPSFVSGYHQTSIEQDLDFSVAGATVSCSSLKELKDHETLSMRMYVTDTMFPQSVIKLQNLQPFYIIMGVSAGLALLYWILFLRNLPPRFRAVAQPLEGYSGGQLSSVLSLKGADLTMMVFTWAQLGYVLIQMDKRERVLLHKRMDMGNERSLFERKCFNALFGKQDMVDASGLRYALTCQKIARFSPNIQGLVHPNSGSFMLFRIFMTIVGLLDGICIGLTVSAEAAIPWIPGILMGLLCAIFSWFIQLWTDGLVSSRKERLYIGMVFMVAWLAISLFTGTSALDIWVILGQVLAGLMITFGGRRTPLGRQYMGETLGLLLYLQTIPRTQVVYLSQRDPEFFFSLAPYALALGVEKAFASRFGRNPQPPCPWLIAPVNDRLTASQWTDIMNRAIRSMRLRQRRMNMDNAFSILRSFIR